ncbi:hypothetical protein [Basfia succiniciproducens]|uniref:Uncharacterized protein n=1 Tax=Basfia succiniciproducens TaxID=653940 RepID=A0A1G5CJB2_9PAST|nr:hypothetical protein [Basfia succiniciproducens]QIM68893.1 hypothetical protein A4G13_05560 [Basfia succiniciproducens]SCY02397.1 hypothetical protein SAMN02910354_01203 [Basfia succiniciproducens]SEQ85907.1 hypothetical protein SAMN02910415_02162 [Basfia succiniciproducens]
MRNSEPNKNSRFFAALWIGIVLALGIFAYGVYSYFDILAWEQSGQMPHIGAFSALIYNLFGAVGILLGYGLLALIVFVQGWRAYKRNR